MENVEAHYVHTNGVNLHVLQAGPTEGPLFILLHGFPEFSHAWSKQINYFADIGYRVWAPDQRGYNLSDKPKGIKSYTLDVLSLDVIGLMDAAEKEQAFLVGHDWGGMVAWYTALKYPERIKKMVILNSPHPNTMKEHLLNNPKQRARSKYIFDFQTPWVPELKMRLQNFEGLKNALLHGSRPGTFSETDLKKYHETWSRSGAYHAMVNWYRAFIQIETETGMHTDIIVPTLLIWSKLDKYFEKVMVQESIDMCEDGHLVVIEGALHWVHHDEPVKINRLIKEFFES